MRLIQHSEIRNISPRTSYEDLKRNHKGLEYYFNYVYSSLSASRDDVKMGLEKDVGCQDFPVDSFYSCSPGNCTLATRENLKNPIIERK